MDYLSLGPGPAAEPVAQSVEIDFATRNKRECVAYKHQLERTLEAWIQEQGVDMAGSICYLAVKSFPHDFCTYREVVVKYDENDEVAVTLADWLENHSPMHWDAQAKSELAGRTTEPVTDQEQAHGHA